MGKKGERDQEVKIPSYHNSHRHVKGNIENIVKIIIITMYVSDG